MVDKVEPLHEYLSSSSIKISCLVRHQFVAQQQSQYFKLLKETRTPQSEAVIVGDFSENYSFIVQNAAQGFHWDNSQCTVHPFVIYYRTADQELSNFSVCFLSTSLKHNTIMVYSFIMKLMSYVKLRCPQLQRRCTIFLMDVLANIRTDTTSQISVTMKRILDYYVNGTSLLHPMAKMHVIGLEEQ